jgi:hypothetical protein
VKSVRQSTAIDRRDGEETDLGRVPSEMSMTELREQFGESTSISSINFFAVASHLAREY